MANEVRDLEKYNIAPDWIPDLAENDADKMGAVIMGRKRDLATAQKSGLRFLQETFPSVISLQVESVGFPGLDHLNNVGIDLKNEKYAYEFGRFLQYFFRDKVSREGDSFPTGTQMLERLMASSDVSEAGSLTAAISGIGEKIPVQLEVCTIEDVPVIAETLALMKTVNADQEKKIYLLLSGADKETIEALQAAARGIAHVGVAETPVGVKGSESDVWGLNQNILNSEFIRLQTELGLSNKNIALAVSLSDRIAFTQKDLNAPNASELDAALREALRRFILSLPLRPFHFNTMLKIISKAREAIAQSA
ncbi:MAG: hypothetical protein IPN90_07885 [Elusimicrobia bacterium]|nr:hypothetical protein [Elusimicrobiota bacterium]